MLPSRRLPLSPPHPLNATTPCRLMSRPTSVQGCAAEESREAALGFPETGLIRDSSLVHGPATAADSHIGPASRPIPLPISGSLQHLVDQSAPPESSAGSVDLSPNILVVGPLSIDVVPSPILPSPCPTEPVSGPKTHSSVLPQSSNGLALPPTMNLKPLSLSSVLVRPRSSHTRRLPALVEASAHPSTPAQKQTLAIKTHPSFSASPALTPPRSTPLRSTPLPATTFTSLLLQQIKDVGASNEANDLLSTEEMEAGELSNDSLYDQDDPFDTFSQDEAVQQYSKQSRKQRKKNP